MSVREREVVREGLHQAIDEFVDNANVQDLENISAEALKCTLEKAVSRQSLYKERFGSFYKLSTVTDKLAQTRQGIHKAVKAGRILRVETREGQGVYPAFQFAAGQVVPEISKLVGTLQKGGMDEWSILYWLTGPLPSFDDETPASLALSNDDRFDQVVSLARLDASHWVEASA